MSDKNLVPAKLSVIPLIPIKGLYYIGQYGTSGYASAAKGYIYHYFTNGIPITWEPLWFDNSRLSDDDVYDIVVGSLINKPLSEYDVVIMHSTPDLWPKFWKEKEKDFTGKIVNGYCTWETSRLPKQWVESINSCVNEVWCPSTYNKDCFLKSGVTKTIRIVPHVFLPRSLPSPDKIRLIDNVTNLPIGNDGRYTFYTIGEMNIRKGTEDIIHTFCKAFTEKDPAKLILKVHYRNYFPENKSKCQNMIADILKDYPNHAPVICLLDNMSNNEILALHTIGNCYISLTKAEGFGLTIFDAFNYGKKIIATGYSGHLDFLGNDYPGLVSYTVDLVKGMESFSGNYTEEQEWAYPNLDHALSLMKGMINL